LVSIFKKYIAHIMRYILHLATIRKFAECFETFCVGVL